jgi:hypothetical protein
MEWTWNNFKGAKMKEIKKFRLKASRSGTIEIKFRAEGTEKRFCTPDSDGWELRKLFDKIKGGDCLYLCFEEKKKETK